mmetsp:Transcript_10167/g.11079  ORF Transcript_10167/g.11079 Transcript_10167/m.11079 type:complete len:192 (+) Transcript_10167:27-602(+)
MAKNEKILCLFKPTERVCCSSLRKFVKFILVLQVLFGIWSVYLCVDGFFTGYLKNQLTDTWTYSTVMVLIYYAVLLIQFGFTIAGWKAVLRDSVKDSNAYYTWNRDLWMGKYTLMIGFYIVVRYILTPYPILLKPLGPNISILYFLLGTIGGFLIEGFFVYTIASFNYFLTKGELNVIDSYHYTILDEKYA